MEKLVEMLMSMLQLVVVERRTVSVRRADGPARANRVRVEKDRIRQLRSSEILNSQPELAHSGAE
jgi:hypothetical protein